MKKTLSLTLSFAVAFLASVSVAATPVRGQEVASAGNSISKIKEEYERLLAVERDPETTAEVREMNHKFLEERRTQLRDAIQKRLRSLRAYQTSMAGTLSDSEGLVVGNSIRQLESDLAGLQNVQPEAAPRTRARTTGTARTQPTPDSYAAAVPEPAPAAAEPLSPQATPSIKIERTGDETVTEAKSEIKVELNDPTNELGKNIKVTVASGDSRLVEADSIPRTDDNGRLLPTPSKKVPVKQLLKGENTITVSGTTKGGAEIKSNAVKVTLKAAAEETAPKAAATPTEDLAAPVLTEPKDGEIFVTGTVPDRVAGEVIVVTIDGKDAGTGPIFADGTFRKDVPTLQRDQVVVISRKVGNRISPPVSRLVVGEGENRSSYEAAPTGLLFGGAVMSQQADEFQQADPFFGFVAGYRFGVIGKKPRYIVTPKDNLGNDTCFNPNRKDRNNGLPLCQRAKESNGADAFEGGFGRAHLRFLGIFQAAPRAATPKANATPSPAPGPADPTNFQPFIASRKSFDAELHGWYDFRLGKEFFIGPYGAWGASTVVDKNELIGEKIPVERAESSGNEGSNPDNPPVDGSEVQTDNDVKQYRELGIHMNSLLFSRRIFLESILAHGWYEGLQGLYKGHDTRKRFIGKLRIFPSGVETTAGRQVRLAPLFGVDLNAGRGPDQIRFFTGFAVRIRGLQ